MSETNTLVAEAKKELVQLEQRMAALRTLILAYDDSAPATLPTEALSKPATALPRSKRKRSPIGAFRAAALKAFDKGGEYTAQTLRAAMLAAGYRYALTPNHVSRELGKLVESGEVKSKPNGAYTTYRLGKKGA